MKKYMVMECHLSYAVVLDEDGHFLKVANRHYEVGQTVTDIIEMQAAPTVPQKKKINKWMYSLAAMAACLILIVTTVFQMGQMPCASIYMTINPEVRIDVNKKDVVVGLYGINQDGNDLIEGYDYRKKDLNLVMDELVDRAIDIGYLHEGGKISLVLDADSDEWVVSHSDTLTTHLNEYLNEKLTVTIDTTGKNAENNQVIIPIAPSESDYGESDYGETESTVEQPVSSDSGNRNDEDGQSEYDSSDEKGQSDYEADDESGNYGNTSDSVSDYDEDDSDDDVTAYDIDLPVGGRVSDYDGDNDSQADYDIDHESDDDFEDSASDYGGDED